jgi:hypothetical protein
MVRSTRRANPFCGPGCEPGRWPVVPAPDFQSGGAGFQTRGNARDMNFRALALVRAFPAETPPLGPQTPFFSLLLYVKAKARTLHS